MNVSLRIQTGQLVAVTGKSGSGKSTLLNIIAGIDKPTKGTVAVNGVHVEKLSESELATWRGKNIGVVFQFFQLLPTLTIVENIMLPMDFCNSYPKKERRERALGIARPGEYQGASRQTSIRLIGWPATTRCHCTGISK